MTEVDPNLKCELRSSGQLFYISFEPRSSVSFSNTPAALSYCNLLEYIPYFLLLLCKIHFGIVHQSMSWSPQCFFLCSVTIAYVLRALPYITFRFKLLTISNELSKVLTSKVCTNLHSPASIQSSSPALSVCSSWSGRNSILFYMELCP